MSRAFVCRAPVAAREIQAAYPRVCVASKHVSLDFTTPHNNESFAYMPTNSSTALFTSATGHDASASTCTVSPVSICTNTGSGPCGTTRLGGGYGCRNDAVVIPAGPIDLASCASAAAVCVRTLPAAGESCGGVRSPSERLSPSPSSDRANNARVSPYRLGMLLSWFRQRVD